MGIQPVSQGLTLRSAHAWGLVLWSPFEILNIVALSLKCVFCRCSSVGQWACTLGLGAPAQCSPTFLCFPVSTGGVLSSPSSATGAMGQRTLPGEAHVLPSPYIPGRDQAQEQGGPRSGLCPAVSWVGQGGSCPYPALAVPRAHCLGNS